MAIKYLENVATTHYIGTSLESIQAEYAKWTNLVEKEDPSKKNSIMNRIKMSEIQLNFAKANNLYYKRKFSEARKMYMYVQDLVFKLLYPPFKPGMANGHAAPVKAELFESLLKVGSEIAASLPADVDLSPVSYVSINSLPEDVQKYAQSLDDAGISEGDDKISYDLKTLALLGMEHAQSKEWDNAEAIFKLGLQIARDTGTPEAKTISASFALNLGAVYIQKDEFSKATEMLKGAEDIFKDAVSFLRKAHMAP